MGFMSTSIFEDKKKSRLMWGLLLVISCIFYLIWYWHDGVIMSVDGPTYVSMESGREPAYPVLLWIFRTIFGTGIYLNIVVILQCVVAGIVAVVLAKSLQELFELNLGTVLLILFIEYGVTLLNRFVAQRRYSYYNSICTEAWAYSLWILLFVSLAGILYKKDRKYVVISLVWCIILCSIRKQMLISFCLLFIVLVYRGWKDKKIWKNVLWAFLLVVIGLLATRTIDRTYNYVVRGEFEPHTGDSSFIFGNEIYVADTSMAEYIDSEVNRELFLEIMRRADENQYNIAYAGEGWMSQQDHYSSSYDRIKFNTTMVVIREYLRGEGIADEQFNEYYEKIADEMTKDLLVPCIPGMLRVFGNNVIAGFITTVLKVHSILNWGALLLYVMYIALLIYMFKKHAKSALIAMLVLLAIIINVVFTSLTIYCQMRYALYNTALFYQAGLIMMVEAVRMNRKK